MMKKLLIRLFYKLPFSYSTKMKILKFRRSIIGYKEVIDNKTIVCAETANAGVGSCQLRGIRNRGT